MRTSSTPGKPSQKALSKTARVFLVAVFWLAVWEGVYLLLANDLLVVSPQAVIRRLGELAKTANFSTQERDMTFLLFREHGDAATSAARRRRQNPSPNNRALTY